MLEVAAPPDLEHSGCLGRQKGASRPYGMGLRPTHPPPRGSRKVSVVGSGWKYGSAKQAGLVHGEVQVV